MKCNVASVFYVGDSFGGAFSHLKVQLKVMKMRFFLRCIFKLFIGRHKSNNTIQLIHFQNFQKYLCNNKIIIMLRPPGADLGIFRGGGMAQIFFLNVENFVDLFNFLGRAN